VPGTGPRIAVCLRGGVTADDGVTPVTLRGGESAFAEAGTKPLQISGSGELYVATVGR
jgi:mannose-6-phosphate isomerase